MKRPRLTSAMCSYLKCETFELSMDTCVDSFLSKVCDWKYIINRSLSQAYLGAPLLKQSGHTTLCLKRYRKTRIA